MSQDKGHRGEFIEFSRSINEGKLSPISLESIYYTTMATFKVRESLKEGTSIKIT